MTRLRSALRAVACRLGATRRGRALLPLWAALWACAGRLDERLAQRRMARIIAASGRFDQAFYRAAYPQAAGHDPVWDYVTHGQTAARNPNAAFDTAYYLAMNPDVAAQGIDPFVHYLLRGEAEGRRPLSPLGGAAAALDDPAEPAGDEAAVRSGQADTAIVAHLFHPELWPELLSFLRSVDPPLDLYVSVASDAAFRAVAGAILASVPGAVVRVVPDRGRDMAPLVGLLGTLASYRYVCKVHARAGVEEERARRLAMLRALLGSRGQVRRIKALFDANARLGVIGPAGFRVRAEPDEAGARAAARLGGALGNAARETADFFADAMFWFRPAALAPLARLTLGAEAFEPESGQPAGTLAHALERAVGAIARHAGFRIVDTAAVDLAAASAMVTGERPVATGASRVKLIAFYEPQFHWDREPGRRTTRRLDPWVEVARARPLFAGHLQPRLPSELGFADLGVPAVRAAQAALAARHGIHGFCYRYEWLNGVARHGRPLAAMIQSGVPDFPFCLAWPCDATRGKGELAGDYAAAFMADVIPALRDRRYVRWNGRPVLVIEGIASLPAADAAVASWRALAREAGLGELHLCAVSGVEDDPDRIAMLADAADFDAVVELPALAAGLGAAANDRAAGFAGSVHDYAAIVARDLERGRPRAGPRRHRGLIVGRDDTPRRGGKGLVVQGVSPTAYGSWLEGIITQERAAEPTGDVMVFVSAWNDWMHGAALEPDAAFGRGFLAATAAALGKPARRVRARASAARSGVSPEAPPR